MLILVMIMITVTITRVNSQRERMSTFTGLISNIFHTLHSAVYLINLLGVNFVRYANA